ncbi:MAG: hypothetical protein HND48_22475 [Chloroflexi bacterium]|nr:hypothetical protein [Chloroflexota bacterium]
MTAGALIPQAPVSGGRWLATYYSSTQPTDLVLCDPFHPDPQTFISVARGWDKVRLTRDDLTPAEDFRWTSVDGLEIRSAGCTAHARLRRAARSSTFTAARPPTPPTA